jgi:hypothetical protein
MVRKYLSRGWRDAKRSAVVCIDAIKDVALLRNVVLQGSMEMLTEAVGVVDRDDVAERVDVVDELLVSVAEDEAEVLLESSTDGESVFVDDCDAVGVAEMELLPDGV